MQVRNILIVVVMLLVIGSAGAQKINFPAVGIGTGVILQQNQWDPGFFVEAQCEVGEVVDFIFLVPYVSFWSAQKSEKILTTTVDLNMSQVNFGTELIGYINPKPKGFFTGVGIGYHVIFVDKLTPTYFSSVPDVTDKTETKLSFAALVGYQLKLLAFSYGVKLKYYLINGGYNTFQGGVTFSYNF